MFRLEYIFVFKKLYYNKYNIYNNKYLNLIKGEKT